MDKQQYPTDLTENQWLLIEKFLPTPKNTTSQGGRPSSNLRVVVNGIFYVNKTGCQWRMIPHEFGAWNTVYQYFNRWSKQGLWEVVTAALRALDRVCEGKAISPSGTCIDSQSVKTATQGEEVGCDGNKKVKGRKRHLLVDTLGIFLAVVVTAANIGDREGLKRVVKKYAKNGLGRLRKIWADKGYLGKKIGEWVKALKKTYQVKLEITGHEEGGFKVVKKRWVVERTFSWLGNYRRNSKDYESLIRNSESMLTIAMLQILLHRFP